MRKEWAQVGDTYCGVQQAKWSCSSPGACSTSKKKRPKWPPKMFNKCNAHAFWLSMVRGAFAVFDTLW